jgi:hypothetical protein
MRPLRRIKSRSRADCHFSESTVAHRRLSAALSCQLEMDYWPRASCGGGGLSVLTRISRLLKFISNSPEIRSDASAHSYGGLS